VAPFANMPYYNCTSTKSAQQLLSQEYCEGEWTCNFALHMPVRTLTRLSALVENTGKEIANFKDIRGVSGK